MAKTNSKSRRFNLPGTIYARNGRYWYKVQLPGESKPIARPLKPVGAQYATTDYTAALEIARNTYQQAIYHGHSTIAVNDRNFKYGKIGGFFRRQMKQHFPNKKYRQRWQVESVFSRFKRRLGAYLTARKDGARTVECYLRVLTYDLMILFLLFKKSCLLMFSTEQI